MVKSILLALPLIVLLYVFVIKDLIESHDNIGGGSYDLTNAFTLIGVGIYLFVFNLVLLIQNARGNWIFLLIGGAMLTGVIVAVIRTF